MKTQLPYLFLFGFFLFISTTTFAQEVENIDMDEYFAELQLNENQEPQFDKIQKEYYTNLNTIDTNGPKVNAFKEYKKFKKSRNKQMKGVLNKEQYKLYVQKQNALEHMARDEYRNS